MTSQGNPPIVVSNTTPISELAKVGRMELLRDVYQHIFIPSQVFDELTTGSHPAAGLVKSAGWIEVKPVSDVQLDDLIAHGTWINPKLYREVLAAAGE